MTDIKQSILDTPRALQETLEKGRSEYEALVRRTHWGEGPNYMVGTGTSFLAALTGAYSFEGLLGWPVVAHSSAAFSAYSISVLRSRSIVLAVSKSGESSETLDMARQVQSRQATVLALTNNPKSALAAMAEGLFLVRAGDEGPPFVKTTFCLQAALGYLAWLAARALKRSHPQLDVLEEEFRKLPGLVEWALTQVTDAVQSFASELKGLRSLSIVGGGFYHPVALQWALLLKELAAIHAEGYDAGEFRPAFLSILERPAAVVFLSGSRCRAKKITHQLLLPVKATGAKILSITDRDDRELARHSALTILLPTLTEIAGSTLTFALLAWVAYHAAKEKKESSKKSDK